MKSFTKLFVVQLQLESTIIWIMGVSIHYRGRVTDLQSVKAICDELAAIAEKMNWRYVRLDEDWAHSADAAMEVTEQGSQITGHLPLKGIVLTLNSKCETLGFLFDSNGKLIISPFWDFF